MTPRKTLGDEPMKPPSAEMTKQERMVREFLARYRPPSGEWTEGHVFRMLRQLHRRAARQDEAARGPYRL